MIDQHDPIHRFEPMWGNWTAEEFLGAGSYGRVYKAVRNDGGGKFYSAVKLITIPKDDSEVASVRQMGLNQKSMIDYFDDIARHIVHEVGYMFKLRGETNIVSYEDHQIIHEEGTPHWDILIRMELLIPLDAYTANNHIDPSVVTRLGIEICSALEVCAAHNIIHRDIKDGNVFMNPRGTFKLGDFGIAREISTKSMGMSMRGTPSYVAPEIYNGEHYDLTVDIYSLGIMMYKHLNNGRYPFFPPYPNSITSDDVEMAFSRRISKQIPPEPSDGCDLLKKAVMMAIDPDPKERFQSASAFKKALEYSMGR